MTTPGGDLYFATYMIYFIGIFILAAFAVFGRISTDSDFDISLFDPESSLPLELFDVTDFGFFFKAAAFICFMNFYISSLTPDYPVTFNISFC